MTGGGRSAQLEGGLAIAQSLVQQTALLSVITDQLDSTVTGLASVSWLNMTYCPGSTENMFRIAITSVGNTTALIKVRLHDAAGGPTRSPLLQSSRSPQATRSRLAATNDEDIA